MSYYTDEVARGLEDYYAGRGEAPGYWIGAGSEHEDLRGEVSAEELARLFAARHPRTGDSLGAPYGVREGADRVTGWDLTFSAPKSVSTLWAVGGGDIGLEVRDAHEAAVAAAMDYLGRHAAFSRTGKAGLRQVDTCGLVAAAFVHRTSRAGDPQLHTHVLVSGRVRCLDGIWRALDSRALHRQLKPAGMVYQAALRAELTARLDLEWTAVDRNGQAEVAGVPQNLRRLFSRRRAAVEVAAAGRIAEAEASLGRQLTTQERRRAYQVAVLETRAAKVHGAESDVGLHDRWRAEAAQAGLDPASWMPRALNRRPEATVVEPSEAIDEVLRELAASRSTWRRADVVRHAARHTPATLGDADEARRWIEATTEAVLAHPGVVALAAPAPQPPAELVRRDGRCVFDRHDATLYTTLDTLEIEQRVVDRAAAGRGQSRAVAEVEAVERAIERAGLSEDQAAAVRTVTGNGDTVVCVVGPAGTGKSRAMGAAAEAWRASGIPVRGLAVSAVAAGVLGTEAAIPTDTVAKFLFEHRRPGGPDGRWRLRRGEVVVLDEAGMVASADLARLALLVEEAQAKLVLVGDYAQLGAVEAGGLFRLLAEDHAVELSGVRRFAEEWEREASLRLRARDPSVLALYQEHGRVVESDRLGVLEVAVDRWHRARAEGRSVVVCASDNATVAEICDRVRADRLARGEVEAGGLVGAAGQVVGVGD
ncbi:MAG: relaxase domain-containing protein, partial [Actinobacteria bacterium]|nr:relaxase domain-containing protein [Actinomycetota bacterium]